jgi:outer membrane protein OmpA-like peptidoglycan-associated protein
VTGEARRKWLPVGQHTLLKTARVVLAKCCTARAFDSRGLAMKNRATIIIFTIVAAAALPPTAFAQHVRTLSGDKFNANNLVHVPRPKGPRPRGVGLKPPECTQLRAKASRGLELEPKSDIASIVVEFDVNSASLTPASENTLDTLGQALNAATLKPCCFEIDGYTDASGGVSYNQKLSEERAAAVIDYLASHDGIERERMMPKGYGKSRPLASNASEEGRHKNRRVQVVNLGYGDLDAKD